MLIDTLDKLTSGRLTSKIIFANSEVTSPSPGMKVTFAESDENADAWVCHDETGIWLSSNAHESSVNDYVGFIGFEEPLSAIQEIIFVGA